MWKLAVVLWLLLLPAPGHAGERPPGPEELGALIDLATLEDEPAALLALLAKAVPEGAWLVELRSDHDRVQLEGLAANNQFIADFMSALEETRRLEQIYLVSIARVRYDEHNLKRFVVTAKRRMVPPGDDELTFDRLLGGYADAREVPALARRVSSLGKARGLAFLLFEPLPEVLTRHAGLVPIRVKLEGRYHELAGFLDDLAALPEFVLVDDLALHSPRGDEDRVDLQLSAAVILHRRLETYEVPDEPAPRTVFELTDEPDAAPFRYDAAGLREPFEDFGDLERVAVSGGDDLERIAGEVLAGRGYRLWRDELRGVVCAEKEGWDFMADDEIALLGLVTLHEELAPAEYVDPWWGDREVPPESHLPTEPPEYEPVWREAKPGVGGD